MAFCKSSQSSHMTAGISVVPNNSVLSETRIMWFQQPAYSNIDGLEGQSLPTGQIEGHVIFRPIPLRLNKSGFNCRPFWRPGQDLKIFCPVGQRDKSDGFMDYLGYPGKGKQLVLDLAAFNRLVHIDFKTIEQIDSKNGLPNVAATEMDNTVNFDLVNDSSGFSSQGSGSCSNDRLSHGTQGVSHYVDVRICTSQSVSFLNYEPQATSLVKYRKRGTNLNTSHPAGSTSFGAATNLVCKSRCAEANTSQFSNVCSESDLAKTSMNSSPYQRRGPFSRKGCHTALGKDFMNRAKIAVHRYPLGSPKRAKKQELDHYDNTDIEVQTAPLPKKSVTFADTTVVFCKSGPASKVSLTRGKLRDWVSTMEERKRGKCQRYSSATEVPLRPPTQLGAERRLSKSKSAEMHKGFLPEAINRASCKLPEANATPTLRNEFTDVLKPPWRKIPVKSTNSDSWEASPVFYKKWNQHVKIAKNSRPGERDWKLRTKRHNKAGKLRAGKCYNKLGSEPRRPPLESSIMRIKRLPSVCSIRSAVSLGHGQTKSVAVCSLAKKCRMANRNSVDSTKHLTCGVKRTPKGQGVHKLVSKRLPKKQSTKQTEECPSSQLAEFQSLSETSAERTSGSGQLPVSKKMKLSGPLGPQIAGCKRGFMSWEKNRAPESSTSSQAGLQMHDSARKVKKLCLASWAEEKHKSHLFANGKAKLSSKKKTQTNKCKIQTFCVPEHKVIFMDHTDRYSIAFWGPSGNGEHKSSQSLCSRHYETGSSKSVCQPANVPNLEARNKSKIYKYVSTCDQASSVRTDKSGVENNEIQAEERANWLVDKTHNCVTRMAAADKKDQATETDHCLFYQHFPNLQSREKELEGESENQQDYCTQTQVNGHNGGSIIAPANLTEQEKGTAPCHMQAAGSNLEGHSDGTTEINASTPCASFSKNALSLTKGVCFRRKGFHSSRGKGHVMKNVKAVAQIIRKIEAKGSVAKKTTSFAGSHKHGCVVTCPRQEGKHVLSMPSRLTQFTQHFKVFDLLGFTRRIFTPRMITAGQNNG